MDIARIQRKYWSLPASNDILDRLAALYCVMWFKGSNFTEPEKYDDITDLDLFLGRLANSTGWR